MKKLVLCLAVIALLVSCKGGDKSITVAIPNDPTNEARALMLIESKGLIELKAGSKVTATVNDIASNPHNITFKEVEAAQIPNILKDVDFAVINTNYAISSGLNPQKDSLFIEGSASQYVNIIACKAGNENTPLIRALAAATTSSQVFDFINTTYGGQVVPAIDVITNGYDDSINYEELNGKTISVAASVSPHAEILEVVKTILAAKGINLDIKIFDDYVLPNTVVEDGEIDANYFQHVPYLDEFNATRNTHIVNVIGVHVEPMGFYGGKQSDLSLFK